MADATAHPVRSGLPTPTQPARALSPAPSFVALAFALGYAPGPAQAAPPDTLLLGDTLLTSTAGVDAGAFREVIAAYPHAEGKALVYADGGEFLREGLRRQEARVHLRHVDARGAVREGPTLRRSRRDLGDEPFAAQGFVGGPDYTVWWTREVVPGADNFARVRATAYDGTGEPLAARAVAEWERGQVEHLGTLARASRYGMYAAVAVLTTRRRDRLGAQREAGARLVVEVLGPDGELAHRTDAELPDLRAAYALERLLVDDAGAVTVALAAERWRTRPLTWDDPLIPDYVAVHVDVATEAYVEHDLLPPGQQLRSLHAVDQEPLPPALVAAYAADLARPLAGVSIAPTGQAIVRAIPFDADAIARLPEVATSPPLGRKLSPEYALGRVRGGADGRLYLLLVDVYRPHSVESQALLQRVRERDGLSDGVVLLALDPAGGPDAPQEARFQRLRQRTASGRRGAALVPDGRGGYGLLFNEEPRNLGPQQRRRGRYTALDFAAPTLALPSPDGGFAVATLPYRSPYPGFPCYVYPAEAIVTPDGIGVGFSPIEEGFRDAIQYGFFPASTPAASP